MTTSPYQNTSGDHYNGNYIPSSSEEVDVDQDMIYDQTHLIEKFHVDIEDDMFDTHEKLLEMHLPATSSATNDFLSFPSKTTFPTLTTTTTTTTAAAAAKRPTTKTIATHSTANSNSNKASPIKTTSATTAIENNKKHERQQKNNSNRHHVTSNNSKTGKKHAGKHHHQHVSGNAQKNVHNKDTIESFEESDDDDEMEEEDVEQQQHRRGGGGGGVGIKAGTNGGGGSNKKNNNNYRKGSAHSNGGGGSDDIDEHLELKSNKKIDFDKINDFDELSTVFEINKSTIKMASHNDSSIITEDGKLLSVSGGKKVAANIKDSEIHIVKPEKTYDGIVPPTPISTDSKIIEIKSSTSKQIDKGKKVAKRNSEVGEDYLDNSYTTTSSSSVSIEAAALIGAVPLGNVSAMPVQLNGIGGYLQRFFNGGTELDMKNWTNPPTLEFLNLIVAIVVWSARYPAVFWSTSKAFATVFSLQLIINGIDILLGFAGVSVLYKMQIVGQPLPLQVCDFFIVIPSCLIHNNL